MIILIALFIIIYFCLAWRRLDWAVMFLIAVLPSYLIRFSIFGLPATLLEAMIWVIFLVWLLKSYESILENLKFKILNSKLKIDNRYLFDWEIVLLLFIALIAAGVAGFNSSSMGIWKAYFFEPVLLFIVVINVFRYNANTANNTRILQINSGVKKILLALAISALAISALAIYQKFTGALIDNPVWAVAETRRVVSFFGYPNAVGLYLGPLALVMAGWLGRTIKNFQFSPPAGGFNFQTIFNYKIFKPFFICLVIIMSILSIYFAKSKGALLGVAAGLVVFGLLAGKKIRWVTAAVVLIAAAGVLIYQPARNLAYDAATLKTLSGQIRIAGWSDAWRMLKDGRLLTGAGLANFRTAVAPYHTPGIFIKNFSDPDAQRKLVFNEAYRAAHWQPLEVYLYPHNIVLNFWSELGLAGLLLFVWLIGKYFYMGIHSLSWRGAGLHSAIAGSPPAAPAKHGGRGDPQFRNVNEAKIWIPGQARNDRKKDKFLIIGLICSMVVIVVHGLVDVPYFKNDLAVMFWLLVAMMSLINLEKKYEKDIP